MAMAKRPERLVIEHISLRDEDRKEDAAGPVPLVKYEIVEKGELLQPDEWYA